MLFLITLLGILLRLTFINKPEGLWNDEYVSWYVSSTPFLEGFWSEVLKQCHMPLYYLYLKPFAGFNDLVLRLTSTIPGVIAIPVMYLVGKEFSKKIGIFSAIITSILSFLIYYSQEVRFYSLLFLFSSLSLLFTIKYIKNSSKKNLLGYILSNSLILLTHVLGGIYLFFNLVYVFYKKKKISKSVIIVFATILPIIAFLGLNILKMLPSSQWWGHFSYTNILFLFSDYFSPILTNNVNAPAVFFYNSSLTFWLLIPTIIALVGFIFGIRKALFLNILAFFVILTMSILAICGKLVFITKYSIEILPILILTVAIGFSSLKKIGTILLIAFISLHLFSIFTPNYVTKIFRQEGHRIVGEVLKLHNSEVIVFTYYEPERFERYIDLSDKKTLHISKSNRFEYLDDAKQVLKDVNLGQTVSIVFLNSVSFFDAKTVELNKDNPKIPEMFLTFSSIRNQLQSILNSNYSEYKVSQIGAWTIISAKRIQ